MTKNLFLKNLPPTGSIRDIATLNNKNLLKIILLLWFYECQGILPRYHHLIKYLSIEDEATISKYMKKLRKLKIVLPKINKLDAFGKEILPFLTPGLGLGEISIHKICLVFEILSVAPGFKEGNVIRTGRLKRIEQRKFRINETWHAIMFTHKIMVYTNLVLSSTVTDAEVSLGEKIISIQDELNSKGINTGKCETKPMHYERVKHPLCEWFFNNFGMFQTKNWWSDFSRGIYSLETSDPTRAEALELILPDFQNILKKLPKKAEG